MGLICPSEMRRGWKFLYGCPGGLGASYMWQPFCPPSEAAGWGSPRGRGLSGLGTVASGPNGQLWECAAMVNGSPGRGDRGLPAAPERGGVRYRGLTALSPAGASRRSTARRGSATAPEQAGRGGTGTGLRRGRDGAAAAPSGGDGTERRAGGRLLAAAINSGSIRRGSALRALGGLGPGAGAGRDPAGSVRLRTRRRAGRSRPARRRRFKRPRGGAVRCARRAARWAPPGPFEGAGCRRRWLYLHGAGGG